MTCFNHRNNLLYVTKNIIFTRQIIGQQFTILSLLNCCICLNMAGVPGFEPGNVGIKTLCLTAWRYPYKRGFLLYYFITSSSFHGSCRYISEILVVINSTVSIVVSTSPILEGRPVASGGYLIDIVPELPMLDCYKFLWVKFSSLPVPSQIAIQPRLRLLVIVL